MKIMNEIDTITDLRHKGDARIDERQKRIKLLNLDVTELGSVTNLIPSLRGGKEKYEPGIGTTDEINR